MNNKFIICSPETDFSDVLTYELEYMGLELTQGKDYMLALLDLDACSESELRAVQRKKDADKTILVLGYSENEGGIPDSARRLCDEVLPRPFYMAHLRELVICHLSPAESERERLPVRVRRSRRLILDERGSCVRYADRTFPLSDNELKIMKLLFAHAGEVVSKDEINALLGEKSSNIGNVYICRLREKIDEVLSQRHIVTVRGVGFKLLL